MKAIFTTEDPTETKRLSKSQDMAFALWEIVHNGWRDFKHTEYDYEPAWEKINEILREQNIDIDDLTE